MRRLEENIRRKKLYFSYKDPWEPGHRCMGKGKVHYIEVVSDKEDDGDDEGIGHRIVVSPHRLQRRPITR
jgi:hypothetical protein